MSLCDFEHFSYVCQIFDKIICNEAQIARHNEPRFGMQQAYLLLQNVLKLSSFP